jgi:hypothetical protein
MPLPHLTQAKGRMGIVSLTVTKADNGSQTGAIKIIKATLTTKAMPN